MKCPAYDIQSRIASMSVCWKIFLEGRDFCTGHIFYITAFPYLFGLISTVFPFFIQRICLWLNRLSILLKTLLQVKGSPLSQCCLFCLRVHKYVQSYEQKIFSRYCLCSKPTDVVQNHVFVTILSCESHLDTKVHQKAVDFMHRWT